MTSTNPTLPPIASSPRFGSRTRSPPVPTIPFVQHRSRATNTPLSRAGPRRLAEQGASDDPIRMASPGANEPARRPADPPPTQPRTVGRPSDADGQLRDGQRLGQRVP